MKKRFLSIVLALVLACSLLTIGAAAAESFAPYEGMLRQTLYETWGMGYGVFIDLDDDGQSEIVFVRPAKDGHAPSVEIYRAHKDQATGKYGYETMLDAPFGSLPDAQLEYQAALVENQYGELCVLLVTYGLHTSDTPEYYKGLIDDYSNLTLYAYRDGRFVQTDAATAHIWHTAPDKDGNSYYYPDLGWITVNNYSRTLEEYADWQEGYIGQLEVIALLSPDEQLDGLNGDQLLSVAITGFYDTLYTKYYADPVKWAAGKGITNGTSDYTFSPDEPCTRGQVVTFLWRAAGSPEPKTTRNPFTDVPGSAYYYKAVLWAVEKGITNGTSATAFSPKEPCTRAQVVTFLHRYEKTPKVTASSPFRDVTADKYYYEAVLWAVKNEITNGTTAATFSPNETCTRGQIVTFLYRDLAK